MRNFESIRRHIKTAGYSTTVHEEDVICIELSLEKGTRHQSIFLAELDDDDGRPYLRVSTAIAPTTGMDPKRGVLVTTSMSPGYVNVVSMKTGHVRWRFYTGRAEPSPRPAYP